MRIKRFVASWNWTAHGDPLRNIFRLEIKRPYVLWTGLSIHFHAFGYGFSLTAYYEKPRPAPKKCPKGCPYIRDAGECLRRQGVPGAGGSFGDWCECECHK